MNKILIIIKREFLTRARKKSFIILQNYYTVYCSRLVERINVTGQIT